MSAASSRKWYEANKAKRLEQTNAWRRANSARVAASRKIIRDANPEPHRARAIAWNKANPTRVAANQQAWLAAGGEAVKRALTEAWRARNSTRHKMMYRAWCDANLGKIVAYTAKRTAAKLRATPPWLTPEQADDIVRWYLLGAAVGREVDHIVPLQGKIVCGLHVPWNLQLLTPTENRSKGNRLS